MKNQIVFTKTEQALIRERRERVNDKLVALQAQADLVVKEGRELELATLNMIVEDLLERRPDLKTVSPALKRDENGIPIGLEWDEPKLTVPAPVESRAEEAKPELAVLNGGAHA